MDAGTLIEKEEFGDRESGRRSEGSGGDGGNGSSASRQPVFSYRIITVLKASPEARQPQCSSSFSHYLLLRLRLLLIFPFLQRSRQEDNFRFLLSFFRVQNEVWKD